MRATGLGCALMLAGCLAGVCSGAVKVESPNGGESLPAGSRQVIAWQCDTSIEQAAVEFSYTGGVLWETVTPAARCVNGRGSLAWEVPAVSSPRCLVRVTAAAKSGGSDQSDATFTIFPCSLRMDYDGDCAITIADFQAFAQEWLRCGDPYDPACTGNSPPRITSVPPASLNPGFLYTYIVKAADPDGDRLTYELLQAPGEMTIEPKVGQILWFVPTAGVAGQPVVIQVRDEFGAADVQAFLLGNPQTPEDPTEPEPPQGSQTFTGAPIDGYPSLFERRIMVYTNAVRMAPQQYRDKYMAGFQPSPSNILLAGGPVEPLYYEPALNDSARSHALDMAQNGCFQHDSCDGTSWSERIWGFYPQARMLGENIAAGYSTAKAVIDAWLCDATGGQCAADGNSAAGHRTNMMNAGLRQAGMGYAPDSSSQYRFYWVQDLVSNEPVSKPPIVAVCHDFLLSGKTSFLLNYRDPTGRPPISVQVVISGVAQNMSLDLGSPAAGTYRLDASRAATCREYYFLATTAAGESWRCPGPGVFLTDGEAACSTDYR